MAKSSIISKLFLVMFLCAAINLVPAKALETNVSVDCIINVGIDLIKCAMTCYTRICFRVCASKLAPEVALCINPKPAPSPSPSPPPKPKPSPSPQPSPPPMRAIEAVAMIASSSNGNRIHGSLQFLQHRFHPVKTYIRGRILGLDPGKLHGLHIHFNGSCGDHRNHQGSSYLGLGNVVANAKGIAEFYDAKSSLRVVGGGAQSVLGQALVVHHFGNAKNFGKHCTEKALACGIIHLSKV